MRCTSPRTVGFQPDGKTICWSKKSFSKEYATFQLPCGKCLECRLDYARQWAVRAVHEAQMYPKNCFITLTYSDDKLKSPKLIYEDFQLFMKRLRKLQNDPMGVFVTGEYGDKTRRPHWHAIIFNWAPSDQIPKYKNERGDQVYSSETLTKIWGNGIAELGSVTFHSAGYVARYAAKKIIHSPNGKIAEADHHEWQPISRKSNKHAIGKRWLEQYWPDVFHHGAIILPDGSSCSIPRYYEKWLKKIHPEEWRRYVTEIKVSKSEAAIKKARAEELADRRANDHRRLLTAQDGIFRGTEISRAEIRRSIINSKFKTLQENLKL